MKMSHKGGKIGTNLSTATTNVSPVKEAMTRKSASKASLPAKPFKKAS